MRCRSAAAVVGALVVLSGCGTASSRAATHNPAPSSTAATTTVATTTSAPPPVAATPTTRAAVAGPVPAGFKVQSATFVSVDQGWVLGTAACASPPCTSMARTDDGGGRWVGVPAPRDGLSDSSATAQSGVSEVRFADVRNGFVFGPDLWSTHDGGATWNRVTVGSRVSQVIALEASAGEVDAVVTDCAAGSSPCPGQLWHAPVGGDQFTQVPSVPLPEGVAGPSALSLHGRTGYLVAAGSNPTFNAPSTLWVTTDGTTWASHPAPCGASFSLASVTAVDGQRASALCAGEGAAGSTAKALYATADAGATFTPEGSPAPRGGDGGALAAASAADLAIATSSGGAEIYRSTDHAATWTTALQLADGGLGFGDFGFTDATHGFAVHAPAAKVTQVSQNGADVSHAGPNLATLYRTADGGATWSPVAI
ncbi:MAG: hypothetical protein M3Y91_02085 [Actinomycetota bacterium]|nr:hypothetical protein [Actinomycetota bacterium]